MKRFLFLYVKYTGHIIFQTNSFKIKLQVFDKTVLDKEPKATQTAVLNMLRQEVRSKQEICRSLKLCSYCIYFYFAGPASYETSTPSYPIGPQTHDGDKEGHYS